MSSWVPTSIGCPKCGGQMGACFDKGQTYVQCVECSFDSLYGDGDQTAKLSSSAAVSPGRKDD